MILHQQVPTNLLQVLLLRLHLLNLFWKVTVRVTLLCIYCNSVLSLKVHFSLYVFQQCAISSFKALVLIHILAVLMAYFPKPVHVQLSNKRGEIIVLEKSWQYCFSKLAYAPYMKWIIWASPLNNVVDGGILSKGIVTSSISMSFSIKRGVWAALDFLERDRFMVV